MILPLDTQQIADLDRVGTIIDRQGIDAVPDGLLQSLARDAKTLGVRPVSASILIDRHDPSVARERAFAVLATGLRRAHARHAVATVDPS